MAEVKYFRINTNVRTCAETDALIASLKAIINELLTTAMRAVAQGDIAEYDINTGQTTSRLKYSTQSSILTAVDGYEALLQRYSNRRIPRRVQLVDSKNFRGQ